MTPQIKTTLASGAAFPGKQPKKPRTHKPLDLTTITRTRTPYKPERVIQQHKYDELFKGASAGDCWEVKDGGVNEASALARALRSYLERHSINGIVRQATKTDDGIPRVWLVRVLPPKAGQDKQ